MDVNARCQLNEQITEKTLLHPCLHILPELVKLLVLSFELEVEFLNAVGELLVMDLELEPGDLGGVKVGLVHSIKLMQGK